MKSTATKLLRKAIGLENCLQISSLYCIFTSNKESYEGKIVPFFSLVKQKEGIILDIGANKGVRTIEFAKEFPLCTIFAFEPVVENANVLRKNKSLFGLSNIKIFENALGNEDGSCEMVLPEIEDCKNYSHCSVINDSILRSKGGTVFNTAIKRMDAIDELKYAIAPILAVNIDVENFEWAVLQGGTEILKTHKPIIFCHLNGNYNKLISLSLLKEIGYLGLIEQDGKLSYYDSTIHESSCFIFVHRSFKIDPLNEINRNLLTIN